LLFISENTFTNIGTDYFALYLSNGKIEFHFNNLLGAQDFSITHNSTGRYDDGLAHLVRAEFDGSELRFAVDSELASFTEYDSGK